ncbi:MAG: class I SAM-dependent methyltransferase [Candidatus Acidiferrales bacterium]
MKSEFYTRSFYEGLHEGVVQSAEVIVPLVLQLIPARSVVDIGCGEGAWLATFQGMGVDDILGVDGDYVDRTALKIPQRCFRAADLSIPLALDRTFDLALSLEVAEHLPAASASVFVESLTRLAPAILFSAAIPFQGGTNHVNEQWPEAWAELFDARGYAVVDAIRKRVWQDQRVEWWYAQNTLLFVRRDLLEQNSRLHAEFQRSNSTQLSLVHPRKYLGLQAEYNRIPASGSHPKTHPTSMALFRRLKDLLRKGFGALGHGHRHSHGNRNDSAKTQGVTP